MYTSNSARLNADRINPASESAPDFRALAVIRFIRMKRHTSIQRSAQARLVSTLLFMREMGDDNRHAEIYSPEAPYGAHCSNVGPCQTNLVFPPVQLDRVIRRVISRFNRVQVLDGCNECP